MRNLGNLYTARTGVCFSFVYVVQFIDHARGQLAQLDGRLAALVQSRMNTVASQNPRHFGSCLDGLADRRVMHVEAAEVTFWISEPVHTLTVVQVRIGDTPAVPAPVEPWRPPAWQPPQVPAPVNNDLPERQLVPLA